MQLTYNKIVCIEKFQEKEEEKAEEGNENQEDVADDKKSDEEDNVDGEIAELQVKNNHVAMSSS